jgi:hypothetical protein
MKIRNQVSQKPTRIAMRDEKPTNKSRLSDLKPSYKPMCSCVPKTKASVNAMTKPV